MPSTLDKIKHDLAELSVKDLGELIAHAQAVLTKKREQEKASFLDEVRRMAEERGLDIADLLGRAAPGAKTAKPSRAGGKLAPKYRNPENPEQVWSGRGRAPVWAAPYKDAGKLDEIAI